MRLWRKQHEDGETIDLIIPALLEAQKHIQAVMKTRSARYARRGRRKICEYKSNSDGVVIGTEPHLNDAGIFFQSAQGDSVGVHVEMRHSTRPDNGLHRRPCSCRSPPGTIANLWVRDHLPQTILVKTTRAMGSGQSAGGRSTPSEASGAQGAADTKAIARCRARDPWRTSLGHGRAQEAAMEGRNAIAAADGADTRRALPSLKGCGDADMVGYVNKQELTRNEARALVASAVRQSSARSESMRECHGNGERMSKRFDVVATIRCWLKDGEERKQYIPHGTGLDGAKGGSPRIKIDSMPAHSGTAGCRSVEPWEATPMANCQGGRRWRSPILTVLPDDGHRRKQKPAADERQLLGAAAWCWELVACGPVADATPPSNPPQITTPVASLGCDDVKFPPNGKDLTIPRSHLANLDNVRVQRLFRRGSTAGMPPSVACICRHYRHEQRIKAPPVACRRSPAHLCRHGTICGTPRKFITSARGQAWRNVRQRFHHLIRFVQSTTGRERIARTRHARICGEVRVDELDCSPPLLEAHLPNGHHQRQHQRRAADARMVERRLPRVRACPPRTPRAATKIGMATGPLDGCAKWARPRR